MRAGGVSVVFMTDLITPSTAERTWEPALSASRAKEYERCPLQYRLHVLDGYREPETRAKALGTIVHAVLEKLFALPAQQRTPEAARSQVGPQYEALASKNPEVPALFSDDADRDTWLDEARALWPGTIGDANGSRGALEDTDGVQAATVVAATRRADNAKTERARAIRNPSAGNTTVQA